jgi:hypothetical protein
LFRQFHDLGAAELSDLNILPGHVHTVDLKPTDEDFRECVADRQVCWPRTITPAVGDWMERVDNRRRCHSALGMISPVDYENRFNQTAQAA